MRGFKEFIMRGNLVELAVAFIMATAFAAVVAALVDVIMSLISLVFNGPPNFDDVTVGKLVIGPFITALITFLVIAAVVYFLIVLPYNTLRERRAAGKEPEPTPPPEDIALLQEIRDLLAARSTG